LSLYRKVWFDCDDHHTQAGSPAANHPRRHQIISRQNAKNSTGFHAAGFINQTGKSSIVS
jgi:hypothetical protein